MKHGGLKPPFSTGGKTSQLRAFEVNGPLKGSFGRLLFPLFAAVKEKKIFLLHKILWTDQEELRTTLQFKPERERSEKVESM
ncbi:hypothetical protein NPIL_63491 [Nephila pilipes]|uniref:Uncharacterized protein n=1 Tax=Nephila pilipes TaxID=299642 RepID=A0A8X6U2J5_NEPPI|nr:hypothetical protein NPIL_63491 [Nephila pilipes]